MRGVRLLLCVFFTLTGVNARSQHVCVRVCACVCVCVLVLFCPQARLEKYGTGHIDVMCGELGVDREDGWGRIVAHWQTMQQKDRQIALDVHAAKQRVSATLR